MKTTEKQKQTAATISVASNATLVVGKLIVGISINSISVISEAIHSGIDLMAAVIAFFAVKESNKPPDKQHPFGHGKAEGISGAFEGLLIFIAIILIVMEAIKKLLHGAEAIKVDWGLVVMGLSAVLNTFVSRFLFKVARKTDSLALEADALHLSTDVITSLGVFVGLLLIKLTDWHWLDPLIALGVAIVIGKAAYNITKRAVKDLMDENLAESELDIINKVLKEHQPHFVGFHDLRSRKSGNNREIDLHLVQCRNVKLQDAHDVCDHIEEELYKRLPRVHITIHVEPCEEDCKINRDLCEIDPALLQVHIRADNAAKDINSQ
ncbi:MAG: cation transporter [candidate division Zixibacteria bacterium]|nr:cation transporter [candidate division Zixibacteria bacterium]